MSSLPANQRLQMVDAAKSMVLLGNAKRIEILLLLSDAEIAVGHLSQLVGMSQSAVSQHLAKLRQKGLVSTRRDSQTIYYRCNCAKLNGIVRLMAEMFGEDRTRCIK